MNNEDLFNALLSGDFTTLDLDEEAMFKLLIGYKVIKVITAEHDYIAFEALTDFKCEYTFSMDSDICKQGHEYAWVFEHAFNPVIIENYDSQYDMMDLDDYEHYCISNDLGEHIRDTHLTTAQQKKYND